jgi:hypothetical protein
VLIIAYRFYNGGENAWQIKIINEIAMPESASTQLHSSVFNSMPLHLDTPARNERVYKTLLDLGLYVLPIPDAVGRIDCFIVSTGVPAYEPHRQG